MSDRDRGRGSAGRPSTTRRTGDGYALAEWLHDNMDQLTNRTNEDIADEMGYSRPNIISLWRNGKTKIPMERLPQLAKILGVDLTILLPLWFEQYAGQRYFAHFQKIFSRLVTDPEANLIAGLRDRVDQSQMTNLSNDQLSHIAEIINKGK